ncbi:LOW QUALITY PROTEIN: beta-glucosidase 24 [Jatropha curcas]|uniref:LOW QUALITY PROTEIN: beta-glucosidase 24 n=1 Tax=Jatropha curcas TaxID=180498 RepID=UPI00189363E2|nr:LOW QUALITY PROTEIN: beta-glucosidase 24 [Jatropha curcas]
MKTEHYLFFFLIPIIHLWVLTEGLEAYNLHNSVAPISRNSFPKDFIFGVASSACQSEGAADTDGKKPSIWDTFTKNYPQKIKDRSTGDVADDFYHRYKGKINGGVNPLGVQFYNDLINNLLSNGIKPFVTLLHFDPPQALEDEYGGFLSPQIVKDYVDYADFCFKTFGDRVKLWVTINEPNIFVIQGYDSGVLAPGRCSHLLGNCSAGNSATEPYIVMHHLLLSHSAAVKLYRDKYEVIQKGQIGITISSQWYTPKYNTSSGRLATSRVLDFSFGWYWKELLLYVKEIYNNPTIFITENGMADDASLPLEVGLKDGLRIRYLSSHLSYLLRAIKKGVNVKSYYIWSFFDDFEWSSGYTIRFGITYVDYKNNLKRYLKYSAYWFKLFLAN